MRYIANIVTTKNLHFDPLINKCISISDVISGIPTLIIGWENVKKLYPNVIILNKNIEKDLYWTFDKTERRVDYERDVSMFYILAIKKIKKNIKYIYFSVLETGFNRAKKIVNFIKSDIIKTIYIDNNSFVFMSFDNNVIGFSLDETTYIGISKNKILKIISDNIQNNIITNYKVLSVRMKRIIGNDKVVIPYLFSRN